MFSQAFICRNILSKTGEAVYVRDPEMNILYMNRAAQNLAGPKIVKGRKYKCYHLFGDDNASCHKSCPVEREIRSEESPLRFERKFEDGSGRIHTMRCSALPLIEKGKPESWIVIMEDISALRRAEESNVQTVIRLEHEIGERRRAEEELKKSRDKLEKRVRNRTHDLQKTNKRIHHEIIERLKVEKKLKQSEERFRSIAETAGDAVISMDNRGRVIFWNKAAESIFGYGLDEVLNKPVTVIIPERFKKNHMEGVDRVVSKGRSALAGKAFESLALRKDGSRFPVEISLGCWKKERDTFFSAIVRDITERKHLEKELLKSQKLESLGLLAGGIAHDFNNLLTAILGSISLAKNHLDQSDDTFHILEEAEKASLKARDVTHKLLTFSMGGAPVRKTASVAELIRDSFRFALRGSRVLCKFRIDDDLLPVEMDEVQMSRVISNLAINARQAMPAGGTVSVMAENARLSPGAALPLKEGEYVRISINDSGVGITQNNIDRIFDPYFTTQKGGIGLGLSTSYSIIRNHDGHISVDSKSGLGTTFHILLPASKNRIPVKKRKRTSPLRGSGRILVMDDEEAIRKVTGRILHHIGYEVCTVRNGNEAVDKFRKAVEAGRPFDAVIMDLTVKGGMGGRETLEILRKIDPKVKAIVSSGYSDDPVMADCTKYGFNGAVPKPFQIEELSMVLNNPTGYNPLNNLIPAHLLEN